MTTILRNNEIFPPRQISPNTHVQSFSCQRTARDFSVLVKFPKGTVNIALNFKLKRDRGEAIRDTRR